MLVWGPVLLSHATETHTEEGQTTKAQEAEVTKHTAGAAARGLRQASPGGRRLDTWGGRLPGGRGFEEQFDRRLRRNRIAEKEWCTCRQTRTWPRLFGSGDNPNQRQEFNSTNIYGTYLVERRGLGRVTHWARPWPGTTALLTGTVRAAGADQGLREGVGAGTGAEDHLAPSDACVLWGPELSSQQRPRALAENC